MSKKAVADERPSWLERWFNAHARSFFFALGQLGRQPVGSLITALAIGFTLALPAGLDVLLRNLSTVSTAWQDSTQLSLFLHDTTSAADGERLHDELAKDPEIARSQYLSREQALAEFRALSGFGAALDLLQDNPLPAVIVVHPQPGLDRSAVGTLKTRLEALPAVEQATLDQQWLERLQALLALMGRVVWIITLGLGAAVILIVGNTVRLDIERRRNEIVVMKLIGAPPSFIQRPFLYTGLWYGLAGGLLALLAVQLSLLLLRGPSAELAQLYDSDYRLRGIGLGTTLSVLVGGLLLGIGGALWTVRRHLDRIEPGVVESGT